MTPLTAIALAWVLGWAAVSTAAVYVLNHSNELTTRQREMLQERVPVTLAVLLITWPSWLASMIKGAVVGAVQACRKYRQDTAQDRSDASS